MIRRPLVASADSDHADTHLPMHRWLLLLFLATIAIGYVRRVCALCARTQRVLPNRDAVRDLAANQRCWVALRWPSNCVLSLLQCRKSPLLPCFSRCFWAASAPPRSDPTRPNGRPGPPYRPGGSRRDCRKTQCSACCRRATGICGLARVEACPASTAYASPPSTTATRPSSRKTRSGPWPRARTAASGLRPTAAGSAASRTAGSSSTPRRKGWSAISRRTLSRDPMAASGLEPTEGSADFMMAASPTTP